MSRPTSPPADGTELAGSPLTVQEQETDATVELRMARAAGSHDSGFVVEWQLLPLADHREPPKRSRVEKPAIKRLVELGWQG
ncbi:MAG TPA: hypothetical protein VKX24_06685 [Acidimicrobiia bacterium]|nr:hypothetical protein [Acidimicrobiia bacterium]